MDLSLNLITPVILCGGFAAHQPGGIGAERPKPFQKLSGNLSRFQQTLLRVSDPGRFNPPMIIADQAHQSLIEFEMEMVGIERSALVLEPVGRGTAPSIALAALVAGAFNVGGSLLVMPCDHLVRDPGALLEAIHQGVVGTRKGSMMAFGRKVVSGDENCAWIQRGGHLFDVTGGEVVEAEVYQLEQFLLKSASKDADSLLESGDCYRNSGMYLFPIATVLEELRLHVPDVLSACQKALVSGTSQGKTLMPGEDEFSACQDVSIERAVMEQTNRGALVPTSALWSEEGARPASPEDLQIEAPIEPETSFEPEAPTEPETSIEPEAPFEPEASMETEMSAEPEMPVEPEADNVILHEASNSYAQSTGPLTVVAGLDDVVVVNTGDAVIVAARSHVGRLLEAHEISHEGDDMCAIPEAAVDMLRHAVRETFDGADAEPEEAAHEKTVQDEDEAQHEEADVGSSADEQAEAEPAVTEDVKPEPSVETDHVLSEHLDEEPPLLLHSAFESAA